MKSMITKNNNMLIAWMVLILASSFNQGVIAQEDSEGKLAVYYLQSIPAHDAADMIETIIKAPEARMQVSKPMNSLAIFASEKTHRVVTDLLEKIDVPKPKTKPMVVAIVLKNRPAEAVRDMAMEFMSSEKDSVVRLIADVRSNTLLVTGSPTDIDRVKAFVEVIDRGAEDKANTPAGENVVVRITWLSQGEGLEKPSDSLAELVAELEKSKQLSNVGVLTQSQSTVKVSGVKGTDTFVSSSSIYDEKKRCQMQVDGQVSMSDSGDKYDLSISMLLQVSLGKQKLGSTISLPKNHPVAFSHTVINNQKSIIVFEIVDAK